MDSSISHDPFAPDAESEPKAKATKRKSARKPKETPMQFPRTRLLSAGASDAEVTQLEAEHDAASPEAKESRIRHLEKIAEGDIVEWLEDLRKAGHFGEPEEPAEAAGDAPTDEAPAQEPEGTVPDPEPEPETAEETKPEPKAKRKPKVTEKPTEPEEPAEAAE